jgi:hypothetical protein
MDAMRGGAMSTTTETFRVRIAPGVRMWQALLLAAALVGTLVLGLVLGRAGATAGVDDMVDMRTFAPYMCTGHAPNPACVAKFAPGIGHTAHVPPGGPAAYGR